MTSVKTIDWEEKERETLAPTPKPSVIDPSSRDCTKMRIVAAGTNVENATIAVAIV